MYGQITLQTFSLTFLQGDDPPVSRSSPWQLQECGEDSRNVRVLKHAEFIRKIDLQEKEHFQMLNILRFTMIVALLVIATSPALEAEHHGAYRDEVVATLDAHAEKLSSLAGAIPAEKYTYRPGEGVRSVSEVLLHIASANYFVANIFGTAPPEGLNVSELEKSTTDSGETMSRLKASFAHLKQALEGLPEGEAEKALNMFGRDTTMRGGMNMATGHISEHLGQLIAYARVNGVTPPWNE